MPGTGFVLGWPDVPGIGGRAGEHAGQALAEGGLQEELADSINLDALDKIRSKWEKDEITKWDFGTLPEKIPLPATSSAAEGVFPIPSCMPDRSPYKKGLNAVDDAYTMNVLSAVGLYTPAT